MNWILVRFYDMGDMYVALSFFKKANFCKWNFADTLKSRLEGPLGYIIDMGGI